MLVYNEYLLNSFVTIAPNLLIASAGSYLQLMYLYFKKPHIKIRHFQHDKQVEQSLKYLIFAG
jgi:hypothetical protein